MLSKVPNGRRGSKFDLDAELFPGVRDTLQHLLVYSFTSISFFE